MTGTTVVIGLGSPLMKDDGLGLAALEALQARGPFEPGPDWIDGGTWGMNLLPFIESADRLLLLDAIRSDRPPGSVVVLEREAVPRGLGVKLSPHQIDLQEVLALAELRGRLPQDTVAMGIEPGEVVLGCGLAEAVRGALPALVERAEAQLLAWGHARLPAPAEANGLAGRVDAA